MQTRGILRKYNVLKFSFFSAPYSGDSMQTHGSFKNSIFKMFVFLALWLYIGASMQTRGNFRKYNVLKFSFFSAPYSGDSMQTHGNLKNLISKIFVFLALCLYIGDAMQTCRNSKNTIFNFYFYAPCPLYWRFMQTRNKIQFFIMFLFCTLPLILASPCRHVGI